MHNFRFLVTGGAGFIGSELVRHLAALRASVRVVDNLVKGRSENLESALSDNVELVVADIRDRASMSSLLRDVDVVCPPCLPRRAAFDSLALENEEVSYCDSGTLRYRAPYRREALRLHLDL